MSPLRNMAQAITNGLDLALAEDPRVMVMGEDVGRTGGVFRLTNGLLPAHGAERVVDTPVAEPATVTKLTISSGVAAVRTSTGGNVGTHSVVEKRRPQSRGQREMLPLAWLGRPTGCGGEKVC